MTDITGNNHGDKIYWTETNGGLRGFATTPNQGKVLAEYQLVRPEPKKHPIIRFLFRKRHSHIDGACVATGLILMGLGHIWSALAFFLATAVVVITVELKYKESLK